MGFFQGTFHYHPTRKQLSPGGLRPSHRTLTLPFPSVDLWLGVVVGVETSMPTFLDYQ
jgi:hypothetical protein